MTDLTKTITRLRELGVQVSGAPSGAEFDRLRDEFESAAGNALPALLDAAERAERLDAVQEKIARAMCDLLGIEQTDSTDGSPNWWAFFNDGTDWLLRIAQKITETKAERDRLAAEHLALSEQNASTIAGRRPFSDAMAERTISRQVREIDRLASRVEELEAALRLSRGLLEAVRDNDPNDMAADAVPVSTVWRSAFSPCWSPSHDPQPARPAGGDCP